MSLCINFWSMGCGPCRFHMLHERDAVAQLADKPARVLYVATKEDGHQEAAEKWMRENNIQGEHVFVSKDDWTKFIAYLNFTATPFAIIVDDEGRIVKKGDTGVHELLEMLKKQEE